MRNFNAFKMMISLFLLKMATTVAVHAQPSEDDFLSIDCGFSGNFTDNTTNITYFPDAGFIDTGSNHNVSDQYMNSTFPEQFFDLRSFPTGDRNCYTLPVIPSKRYLVRARFMYGNYDGKNKANADNPLQFDMHLGVNLWAKMNITDASTIYSEEALTVAASTSISVCLINTGNGDPFISVLELRPLKDTMYNLSQSDLALFFRVDIGSLTNDQLRYPEDPYDRIWSPFNPNTLTAISTNRIVNDTGMFEAPSEVLQTAVTPSDGSMALELSFQADSKSEEFYHILYFTEVEVLDKNSTRVLNIYRNGDLRMGNVSLPYLSPEIVYSTAPFSNFILYDYVLNATANSTLPPLINAMEVYSVIPATEVPTDRHDVLAMNHIMKQYDVVERNWMGDPCSPREYIWDGVKCTYKTTSSRITGLNLSSSGLSGPMSSSFAKLGDLTYLDLSNNSLTGAIPDNVGKMQSLQLLILPCNYSTAHVPDSLLQRSKDGQVTLRYNDGADECGKSLVSSPPSSNQSTSSTTNMISEPVFVVLSMVLTLILVGNEEIF